MELLYILIKGFISVIVLLLLTKLMGRKQVGQLNIFDYIIGISIGSIAAEMTLNDEINIIEGIIGMSVYAILAYIISIITMKSIVLRRLIIGSPTIIIQDGKIIERNLRKTKMDINDMLEEARNSGYFDISQIEYSIMEANGRLSFLPKSNYQPLTPKDMKIKTDYNGLTSNLIIDGKIMFNNLKNINKNEKWLITRLNNMGYKDISNLLLVTCNSKEELHIFEKQSIKEKQVLE